MKKALFIYNPNAGKGLLKPKLSDIIDIIVKAGYEVVVYPTQKYKDAYYKVKKFTEEYDRLGVMTNLLIMSSILRVVASFLILVQI